MLTVGDKFPSFNLKATVSNDLNNAFPTSTTTPTRASGWCVFFYPKDFTFVCPTEIAGFGELNQAVRGPRLRSCWPAQHRQRVRAPGLAQGPQGPARPAVPDARRHQARARPPRSASSTRTRAWRSARPSSSIRTASSASSTSPTCQVGRNPEEVLRVLDALQTDELCPCNWQQGRRDAEGRLIVTAPAASAVSPRGRHPSSPGGAASRTSIPRRSTHAGFEPPAPCLPTPQGDPHESRRPAQHAARLRQGPATQPRLRAQRSRRAGPGRQADRDRSRWPRRSPRATRR